MNPQQNRSIFLVGVPNRYAYVGESAHPLKAIVTVRAEAPEAEWALLALTLGRPPELASHPGFVPPLVDILEGMRREGVVPTRGRHWFRWEDSHLLAAILLRYPQRARDRYVARALTVGVLPLAPSSLRRWNSLTYSPTGGTAPELAPDPGGRRSTAEIQEALRDYFPIVPWGLRTK